MPIITVFYQLNYTNTHRRKFPRNRLCVMPAVTSTGKETHLVLENSRLPGSCFHLPDTNSPPTVILLLR